MKTLIALCLMFGLAACAKSQALPANVGASPIIFVPTSAMATKGMARHVATANSTVSDLIVPVNGRVRVLNVTTGKDAADRTPLRGSASAFSDDGAKFALVQSEGEVCAPATGGTACYPATKAIHSVDAKSWQSTSIDIPSRGYANTVRLNSDGSRAAFAWGDEGAWTLVLADTATGHALASRRIEFAPTLIWFQDDESTLAIYGQVTFPTGEKPAAPQVLLLDAATLDTEWETTLDIVAGAWCDDLCNHPVGAALIHNWHPAVVPAPDGGKLYVLHADSYTLTTVDLTGHTVRNTKVEARETWFERLLAVTAGTAQAKGATEGAVKQAVLSADGSRLYAVTVEMSANRSANQSFETHFTARNLMAIDSATGAILAERPIAAAANASVWVDRIELSPDDSRVILVLSDTNDTWRTESLDSSSLEPSAQLKGWRVIRAHTADARTVLLGHKLNARQGTLALVDANTLNPYQTFELEAPIDWLAY